jgi:hypothetical protein
MILILALPLALGGCLAVAATGAVVGTAVGVTGAVVGTTAKVGKAAVGAAIPDGDEDERDQRRD